MPIAGEVGPHGPAKVAPTQATGYMRVIGDIVWIVQRDESISNRRPERNESAQNYHRDYRNRVRCTVGPAHLFNVNTLCSSNKLRRLQGARRGKLG